EVESVLNQFEELQVLATTVVPTVPASFLSCSRLSVESVQIDTLPLDGVAGAAELAIVWNAAPPSVPAVQVGKFPVVAGLTAKPPVVERTPGRLAEKPFE